MPLKAKPFQKYNPQWLFVVAAAAALLAALRLEHYNSPLLSVMAYGCSYGFGGYFGAKTALNSLRKGDIDIDILMLLAALGAAFVGAPLEGALLLLLFATSNALCDMAFNKTQQALENLMEQRPQRARVRKNGAFQKIPIGEVQMGDSIFIRPGEQIPLDGILVQGEATIDQSRITGEPIPQLKSINASIFAGSFNCDGAIEVKTTSTSENSTLAQILKLIQQARQNKDMTQRFLERFEKRYALGVILATLTLIATLPTLFHLNFSEAFYRAITFMVVASPCALIIATPVAVLSALSRSARKGILFKGGAALENLNHIEAIGFDKTGTLTEGHPKLCAVLPWPEQASAYTEDELLSLAASAEQHAAHPIGKAISQAAADKELPVFKASEFRALAGVGIFCSIEQKSLWMGSPSRPPAGFQVPAALHAIIQNHEARGATVVLMAEKTKPSPLQPLPNNPQAWNPIACLILQDPIRTEAAEALESLRVARIEKLFMLTGDSPRTADTVAQTLRVEEVHAGLLPKEKAEHIQKIAATTPVAMVGDGFNDAPALSSANIGIAMGASGSDLAIESADIILMQNDLTALPQALHIAQATRRIVLQNLSFAGAVILIMATNTLLLPLWDITVPLPLAVVAHEGSTVLACLNGLRMLRA